MKPSGLIITRWTAWRGRGAPQIGCYSGPTDAAVIEAERADIVGLSKRFAEARDGIAKPTKTLADLLELWRDSAEFGAVADSTQAERLRTLKKLRTDLDPDDAKGARRRADMPVAALAAKRAHAEFKAWRDHIAKANGPRAADYRMETLKTALSWAVANGHATANPALGIKRLSNADRSELIWEPMHNEIFFAAIKKKIWEVWTTTDPADPRRWQQIARLAAARDAMILAQNSGMRRENLSTHKWSELQPPAIAYTALKGARRARTAGKKSKVTVVPILPEASRVYARRREATGHLNPWVLTSSRGGRYTPNALGHTIYALTKELAIERTLHDAKGTFVTHMLRLGEFSKGEIAEMVDWSEDEVDVINKRYVSAPAIASAMIERMRRRQEG